MLNWTEQDFRDQDARVAGVMEKFRRSEASFKDGIEFSLMTESIPHQRECVIFRDEFWRQASLIADFASWNRKTWVIEAKRKADISSCQKALGQCLMYRQLAKYENAIICFPEREMRKSFCLNGFKQVCESHKIILANENNIIEIIKRYEPTTNTCSDSKL